jgi:nucleotidyltransferase/DNA polymerase involved in DNA repair
MSILYCNIPHLPVALARQTQPALIDQPLVLLGPEARVLDASAEAAARGVSAGLTAHVARVRCPEACLLDADVVRCQETREELLEVLERFGTSVEPHGWGAAYVDLDDMACDRQDAIALCSESGRAVRAALGGTLQPALGWNSSKFTSQVAARSTRPGRLLAVDAARERGFLGPLPVALLPLAQETIQRLHFLGLRTLGQYAALPPAAVWQQFGRAGKRAQRYARGEDDRPVVSRHQERTCRGEHTFEVPVDTRERLLAALKHVTDPLLASLHGHLQACGQVCLDVRFDDGSAEEKIRTFVVPVSDSAQINRALGNLLDTMRWPAGAISVSVTLKQIQEAVMEQLTFLPSEDERASKIRQVQRYLTARFGASRLWRATLVSPGAPLPEWRVAWRQEE